MPKRLGAKLTSPSNPVTRRRRVADLDPEFHYHFARADRVDIHREDRGYTPVELPGGGVRTSGQDVLMKCPREEYEARARERRRLAVENRKGPMEAFKMQGLRAGVPVVDVSKERQGHMRSVLGERDPRVN